MSSIHPRDFFSVYVAPSMGHYFENRIVEHLAVNAISQMDNLAEVVAIYLLPPGTTKLRRRQATEYRDQLRQKHPALGVINDAHDCHKHGNLNRPSSASLKGMASGRPTLVTEHGFFLDETELDGDLTPYDTLAVTLNDGTQWEVVELLCEARQAWNSEFQALGI